MGSRIRIGQNLRELSCLPLAQMSSLRGLTKSQSQQRKAHRLTSGELELGATECLNGRDLELVAGSNAHDHLSISTGATISWVFPYAPLIPV